MTFSSSKVRRKRKNINREIFFDWKINSQCSICEESIWAVQRMFSSWEWSGLWWCIYFWIAIRISWDMKIIHFPMTNSQLQANHIKPTWMPCINLTISVCFCFSMSMHKRVCWSLLHFMDHLPWIFKQDQGWYLFQFHFPVRLVILLLYTETGIPTSYLYLVFYISFVGNSNCMALISILFGIISVWLYANFRLVLERLSHLNLL